MEIDNILSDILVTPEVALLLQKKGFDVICEYGYGMRNSQLIRMYNRNSENVIFSAPTQSLALLWLRNNFGIYILPDLEDVKVKIFNYVIKWHDGIRYNEQRGSGYRTYELALEKGLYNALSTLCN